MALKLAELELEADKKLEDLKRRLGRKAVTLQGRRPSGLKASMIYILVRGRGLGITRKQLSENYGITEQTLWNNTKLLKQLMQNPARK